MQAGDITKLQYHFAKCYSQEKWDYLHGVIAKKPNYKELLQAFNQERIARGLDPYEPQTERN